MPKVARPESSKPTTAAEAFESEQVQKKKTRRSKPGSRSKKQIKLWTSMADSALPIRFQRFARITRELLDEVIEEHYKDELGDKKPKFRKEYMRKSHGFTVRKVIKELRGGRKLSHHAGRPTLMTKDWEMTQEIINDLS